MLFNDEYFEGVSLKLKDSFLVINPDVAEALTKFKEVLENAKFGVADPQHNRNLYELNNYKSKREDRLARDKVAEEGKRRTKELHDKYISLDIIPLIQKSNISISDYLTVKIGEKEYSEEEYTTKTGVKKHIVDKIKSYITNKETLLYFCKENKIYIREEDLSPLTNYKDIVISVQHYGFLRISIGQTYGKIYEHNKRTNELQYRQIPLYYNWELNKFTTGGIKFSDLPQVFENYELVGEQLVKIK